MIKNFRSVESTLSYDLLEQFTEKMENDILHLDNNSCIYAFLDVDSYGVNCNYLTLKILKKASGVFFENERGDVMSIDDFRVLNRDYPVGYCISKNDAEMVKLLRAKKTIEEFCSYIGFDDLKEFIKTHDSFITQYPEKLI